jgi:hypothetical protein
VTGRSRQILSRFPAHFEATRPGKQFEVVVDALSSGLDSASADLARVRRSHRLADADELHDLLLIAGFHGITPSELAIAFTRIAAARDAVRRLQNAASAADRDKAVTQLIAFWGIDAAPPVLLLYAPPASGGPPDLNAAKGRLLHSAGLALAESKLLDVLRARIANISALHSHGNGTIAAVLQGAANALDLDLAGPIQNSDDRFWHAAVAHDRIALTFPVDAPATATQPAFELETPFKPAHEVIGMEENPLERNVSSQVARHDAELFSIIRRGFDRVLLQIRITGKETLTLAPMVVNRDEGHGMGYALAVPSGSMLVFTEQGRVLLDGSDVTSFAFAWKGACFAGPDARPSDFVFDAPGAVFVETTPAGALDPGFSFPGSGESLPMPGIEVGETRFAFFVQQAYYSEEGLSQPAIHLVAPRTAVGFLDGSVFAPADGESAPQAALVSFSWLEHRAFCVRVLIPSRFRALTPDDPDGAETRQRVAQALDRFRPAGVEMRVEFIDDRWILGQGILVSGAADDPIAQLRSGTALWAVPRS